MRFTGGEYLTAMETDFDVFTVLEDEIRIATEEINTKDAT